VKNNEHIRLALYWNYHSKTSFPY